MSEAASAAGPRPEVTLAPGTSTGIGSMPGTDVRESMRTVVGELPDLPHLVELPARGAGADMIGRTLALLPDFAATTVPSGWRLSAAAGADARRALAWLGEDLDAAEEIAGERDGAFKAAVVGPLTLAAGVELGSGERLVRDHGAVRDLTAALVDAIGAHVADLRRRLPRASLVVQIDEPALPAVLAGRVPTASGFRTLRSIDVAVAEAHLRAAIDAVVAAGALPVVHCCAGDVPVDLLRRCGARGVSLDAALLPVDDVTDARVGECVEAGVTLLLGVVPTDGGGPSDPAGTVRPVRTRWHRLGLEPERLATAVVLTPACGLAGASPSVARAVLARVRAAGRLLVDEPEERS